MKEEDKKEASTASEAEKPSNEASSSSIKTEAMEAEDAGEKSKSEAEAKSKAEASTASTSAASDGKIKAEAKSVLPSGEAGDGDMDEAAMRRALQVRKFGISVWNSGKLKTFNLGKISSNWKKFCNEC